MITMVMRVSMYKVLVHRTPAGRCHLPDHVSSWYDAPVPAGSTSHVLATTPGFPSAMLDHITHGREKGCTMLIQAALNGDRSRDDIGSVPLSADQLVADAVACVAAGASMLHIHPRDEQGRERLDASIVDPVVRRVRAACHVPVGVTTGAWIEPDLERRLALIRAWTAPDYTSVNVSEPGFGEVMETLLRRGIGIEAGVWTVADADALAASGMGNRVTRILVEPGERQVGSDVPAALILVADIHAALDRHGLHMPRLQHADGANAWAVLRDACRRGLDTRIGLEDTWCEPEGTRTTGNASLVRAASRIRREFVAGTI
jgi:uncharacterized protein (DUF849 family)